MKFVITILFLFIFVCAIACKEISFQSLLRHESLSIHIRVNCARIVPLLSEHENAYISSCTQRILIIFFFKYSLVSILLTTEISSILTAVAIEFTRKKGKKSVFLASPTVENHLFVAQFWSNENSFLRPFCSQYFPLSNHVNRSQLWFRFTDQILQKLPKHTLWPFYVTTD